MGAGLRCRQGGYTTRLVAAGGALVLALFVVWLVWPSPNDLAACAQRAGDHGEDPEGFMTGLARCTTDILRSDRAETDKVNIIVEGLEELGAAQIVGARFYGTRWVDSRADIRTRLLRSAVGTLERYGGVSYEFKVTEMKTEHPPRGVVRLIVPRQALHIEAEMGLRREAGGFRVEEVEILYDGPTRI